MISIKRISQNVRMYHAWTKPDGYDTTIKVYNCVAKEKVPLVVGSQHRTTWYTCGPTVYDSAHIGHASCYVKLDIIQRVLRNNFNINLVTAMNITDVDDKIIRKSNISKISCSELARHYETEFWNDLEALNVIKADKILRVTDYMNSIQGFCRTLIEKEVAYKDSIGSVIFDVSKRNSSYGKLQNIGAQMKTEENKSKINFTIWKAPKQNEPFWDNDKICGPGRPGWHTECSALASEVFGSSIDIHAGGIDLRFPHHENEEVQCCSYFSKPQWVNYWLHTGHLLDKSTKMSKSLNNVISIQEMLKRCSPNVFRMMCLMSHYSHNMEFTSEYIKTAESILNSYKNFVTDCDLCLRGIIKSDINEEALTAELNDAFVKVQEALRDDFNTSTSIKALNSLMKVTNKMIHSSSVTTSSLPNGVCLQGVLNFVTSTFEIFGVKLSEKVISGTNNTNEVIDLIIDFRQKIRLKGIGSKNNELLKLCDDVRNKSTNCGILIKDYGKISSSWSLSEKTINSDSLNETVVDLITDFTHTVYLKGITDEDKELLDFCDVVVKKLEGSGISIKDLGKASAG